MISIVDLAIQCQVYGVAQYPEIDTTVIRHYFRCPLGITELYAGLEHASSDGCETVIRTISAQVFGDQT